MADYWKSNPRKYCEFCSCWYADNKISRDLHEAGNRHKANVTKRLGLLRDKESAKQKEEFEMSATLAEIERAAVSAYHDDLCVNPTLASSYGKVSDTVRVAKTLNPDRRTEDKCKPDGWSKHVNLENKTYYTHEKSGRSIFKRVKKESAMTKEMEHEIGLQTKPIGQWQPVQLNDQDTKRIVELLDLPEPASVRQSFLSDTLFVVSDDDVFEQTETPAYKATMTVKRVAFKKRRPGKRSIKRPSPND